MNSSSRVTLCSRAEVWALQGLVSMGTREPSSAHSSEPSFSPFPSHVHVLIRPTLGSSITGCQAHDHSPQLLAQWKRPGCCQSAGFLLL